jgi:uncharacterized protein YjiS (DUF1127 family)
VARRKLTREAAMTSGIARRTKLVAQPHRLIRSRAIGTAAAAVVQAVRRIVVAIKHRRELTRLAESDDRMLADIGLSRSELDAVLSRTFWQDPTSILERHGRHLNILERYGRHLR